jgi:predicted amino acid-binding ACT domain protein
MGLTAKVASALAAENVNILAGTGYSASGMRRKATFTLIVDNLEKAERALERIGADEIQDSMVILVETENKVGALEKISKAISDAGINIYYFYSTQGGRGSVLPTEKPRVASRDFEQSADTDTVRGILPDPGASTNERRSRRPLQPRRRLSRSCGPFESAQRQTGRDDVAGRTRLRHTKTGLYLFG